MVLQSEGRSYDDDDDDDVDDDELANFVSLLINVVVKMVRVNIRQSQQSRADFLPYSGLGQVICHHIIVGQVNLRPYCLPCCLTKRFNSAVVGTCHVRFRRCHAMWACSVAIYR